MRTQRTILREAGENDKGMILLMRLCAAVRQLQAAQRKLETVLRPTHDRILVSEASELSEACADELQGLNEELEAHAPLAEAA